MKWDAPDSMNLATLSEADPGTFKGCKDLYGGRRSSHQNWRYQDEYYVILIADQHRGRTCTEPSLESRYTVHDIAANIGDTAKVGNDACFPEERNRLASPTMRKPCAIKSKFLLDAITRIQQNSWVQGAAQANLSQSKLLSLLILPEVARTHCLHPLRLRRPDREQSAADSLAGAGGAAALQGVVCSPPLPWP